MRIFFEILSFLKIRYEMLTAVDTVIEMAQMLEIPQSDGLSKAQLLKNRRETNVFKSVTSWTEV